MSAAPIEVSATYDVSLDILWDELRHIDRHVNWMSDAESIEFDSDQRSGEGTTFRCRTRVGPFVTVDEMTVTSWVERQCLGVEHRGLIRGSGAFTLTALNETSCRLDWNELLIFPWWLGGGLGARSARPVLRALWRKNLRRLGNCLPRI